MQRPSEQFARVNWLRSVCSTIWKRNSIDCWRNCALLIVLFPDRHAQMPSFHNMNENTSLSYVDGNLVMEHVRPPLKSLIFFSTSICSVFQRSSSYLAEGAGNPKTARVSTSRWKSSAGGRSEWACQLCLYKLFLLV